MATYDLRLNSNEITRILLSLDQDKTLEAKNVAANLIAQRAERMICPAHYPSLLDGMPIECDLRYGHAGAHVSPSYLDGIFTWETK